MPETDLPFIDEHVARCEGSVDAVWSALLAELRRIGAGGATLASLLGCDPARATPTFEGRSGETVPGFRIAAAVPGRRLELAGRHGYATYTLTFVLDGDRLRARTHAAFPGYRGRLYRILVIGTGIHALVTRRMLRQIVRAIR